jgi:hypothetical protein
MELRRLEAVRHEDHLLAATMYGLRFNGTDKRLSKALAAMPREPRGE